MSGVIIDVKAPGADQAARKISGLEQAIQRVKGSSEKTSKSLDSISPVNLIKTSQATREINANLTGIGTKGTSAINSLNASGINTTAIFNNIKVAAAATAASVAALSAVAVTTQWEDGLTNISNKLKLIVKDTERAASVQDRLKKTAAESRGSLAGATEIYANLTQAFLKQGISEARVMKLTAGIQKMVAMSSGTAASKQAGLTQLMQGIGSTLQGEELRSVFENINYMGYGLQEQFKRTAGELVKFAESGALSNITLVNSLDKMTDKAEKDFANWASTNSDAARLLYDNLKITFAEIVKMSAVDGLFAKTALSLSNDVISFSNTAEAKFYNIDVYVENIRRSLKELPFLAKSMRAFTKPIESESFSASLTELFGVADIFLAIPHKINKIRASIQNVFSGMVRDILVGFQSLKAYIFTTIFEIERYVKTRLAFVEGFAFGKGLLDKIIEIRKALLRLYAETDNDWIRNIFNRGSIVKFTQSLKTDVLSSLTFIAGAVAGIFGASGSGVIEFFDRVSIVFAKVAIISKILLIPLVALSKEIESFTDKTINIAFEVGNEDNIAKFMKSLSDLASVINNIRISIGNFISDTTLLPRKLGEVLGDLIAANDFESFAYALEASMQLIVSSFSAITGFTIGKTSNILSYLEDLKSELHDLDDYIDATKDGLDSLLNLLRVDTTNIISKIFSDINREYIVAVSAIIAKTVDALPAEFEKLFTNIFNRETGYALGASIAKILSRLINNAFVKIKAFVIDIDTKKVEKKLEYIKRLIDSLFSFVKGFGEGFKDNFNLNIDIDFKELKKAKAFISDLQETFLAAVSDMSKSIKLKLPEFELPDFSSKLKDYSPALDAALSNINNFTAKAAEYFRLLYDKVVGHSYWPDMIDGVVDYVKNIWPAERTIYKFAEKVKQAFITLAKLPMFENLRIDMSKAANVVNTIVAALAKVDIANALLVFVEKTSSTILVVLYTMFGGIYSKLVSTLYFSDLFVKVFGLPVDKIVLSMSDSILQIMSAIGSSVTRGFSLIFELVTKIAPGLIVSLMKQFFGAFPIAMRGFFSDMLDGIYFFLANIPKIFLSIPVLLLPLSNKLKTIGLLLLNDVSRSLLLAVGVLAIFSKNIRSIAGWLLNFSESTKVAGAAVNNNLLAGFKNLTAYLPLVKMGLLASIGLILSSFDNISFVDAAIFTAPFIVSMFIGSDKGMAAANALFNALTNIGIGAMRRLKPVVVGLFASSGIATLMESTVANFRRSQTQQLSRVGQSIGVFFGDIGRMYVNLLKNSKMFASGDISFSDMLFKEFFAKGGKTYKRDNTFFKQRIINLIEDISKIPITPNKNLGSYFSAVGDSARAVKTDIINSWNKITPVFASVFASITSIVTTSMSAIYSVVVRATTAIAAVLKSRFGMFIIIASILTTVLASTANAGDGVARVTENLGATLLKVFVAVNVGIFVVSKLIASFAVLKATFSAGFAAEGILGGLKAVSGQLYGIFLAPIISVFSKIFSSISLLTPLKKMFTAIQKMFISLWQFVLTLDYSSLAARITSLVLTPLGSGFELLKRGLIAVSQISFVKLIMDIGALQKALFAAITAANAMRLVVAGFAVLKWVALVSLAVYKLVVAFGEGKKFTDKLSYLKDVTAGALFGSAPTSATGKLESVLSELKDIYILNEKLDFSKSIKNIDWSKVKEGERKLFIDTAQNVSSELNRINRGIITRGGTATTTDNDEIANNKKVIENLARRMPQLTADGFLGEIDKINTEILKIDNSLFALLRRAKLRFFDEEMFNVNIDASSIIDFDQNKAAQGLEGKLLNSVRIGVSDTQKKAAAILSKAKILLPDKDWGVPGLVQYLDTDLKEELANLGRDIQAKTIEYTALHNKLIRTTSDSTAMEMAYGDIEDYKPFVPIRDIRLDQLKAGIDESAMKFDEVLSKNVSSALDNRRAEDILKEITNTITGLEKLGVTVKAPEFVGDSDTLDYINERYTSLMSLAKELEKPRTFMDRSRLIMKSIAEMALATAAADRDKAQALMTTAMESIKLDGLAENTIRRLATGATPGKAKIDAYKQALDEFRIKYQTASQAERSSLESTLEATRKDLSSVFDYTWFDSINAISGYLKVPELDLSTFVTLNDTKMLSDYRSKLTQLNSAFTAYNIEESKQYPSKERLNSLMQDYNKTLEQTIKLRNFATKTSELSRQSDMQSGAWLANNVGAIKVGASLDEMATIRELTLQKSKIESLIGGFDLLPEEMQTAQAFKVLKDEFDGVSIKLDTFLDRIKSTNEKFKDSLSIMSESGFNVSKSLFSGLDTTSRNDLTDIAARMSQIDKLIEDLPANDKSIAALVKERLNLVALMDSKIVDSANINSDVLTQMLEKANMSTEEIVKSRRAGTYADIIKRENELRILRFAAENSIGDDRLKYTEHIFSKEKELASIREQSSATLDNKLSKINDLFGTSLNLKDLFEIPNVSYDGLASFATQVRSALDLANETGVMDDYAKTLTDKLNTITRYGTLIEFYKNLRVETEKSLRKGVEAAFETARNVLPEHSLKSYLNIPSELRKTLDDKLTTSGYLKQILELPNKTKEQVDILEGLTRGVDPSEILRQFTDTISSDLNKMFAKSEVIVAEKMTSAAQLFLDAVNVFKESISLFKGDAISKQQIEDKLYGSANSRKDYVTSASNIVDMVTANVNRANNTGFDNNQLVDHLLRLIKVESNFKPNAISPKGAMGYMQVMPSTGRDPGYGIKPLQDNSIEENIRFGVELWLNGLERSKNIMLADIAYNGGQGRANDFMAGKAIPQETAAYPGKIAKAVLPSNYVNIPEVVAPKKEIVVPEMSERNNSAEARLALEKYDSSTTSDTILKLVEDQLSNLNLSSLSDTLRDTGLGGFSEEVVSLMNTEQIQEALELGKRLVTEKASLNEAIRDNDIASMNTIATSMNNIKDAETKLVEGITHLTEATKEAAESFASTLKNDIQTTLFDIFMSKSEGDIFENILNAFTTNIIDQFTKGLTEGIFQGLNLQKTGEDLGAGLFKTGFDLFGNLFKGGGDVATGANDLLLGDFGGSATDSAVTDVFGSDLTSSLGDITGSLDDFSLGLDSSFGEGVSGLGTIFSDGIAGFGDVFGSIISGIGSVFSAFGFGFSGGGLIGSAFASGGLISGPGTGTSDSILAAVNGGGAIRVSKDEFIVNARATKKHRALIEAINRDMLPTFANGGAISDVTGAFALPRNKKDSSVKPSVTSRKTSQVFNINVTGDVSAQTRRTILTMVPELATGVNRYNKEKNIK